MRFVKPWPDQNHGALFTLVGRGIDGFLNGFEISAAIRCHRKIGLGDEAGVFLRARKRHAIGQVSRILLARTP